MFWFNRKKEIGKMLNGIAKFCISEEDVIAERNEFLKDFEEGK